MRLTWMAFGLNVLSLLIMSTPLRADDTVVNTPVLAGQLRGDWELRPAYERMFKQKLHLGGSVEGSWHQSREALPVTIAWFVEGAELRISHYYESDAPFNYRVKDLTFAFKVDGDRLTLTRDGVTQAWRRVPEAAAARTAP